MNRAAESTATSDDDSKSGRVYKELRRRIRDMELLPGTRIRKNEVAMEYGVSRAPVSEAIARLAEEGLIDVFPQNGSFVSPIRSEDVSESLLIRTGLEIEAVRRVAQQPDPAMLEKLEENLKAQSAAVRNNDMERLDDLDEAFHGIIFSAVNSRRAKKLLDAMRAILDRPRFHALPEDGRPKDTVAEHRRIVDAIRTGDVELAAATMRVHLTMVARAIDRDVAQFQADTQKKGGK